MSLVAKIKDAWGTATGLKVNKDGAIDVVVHGHPPTDERVTALPFRQSFLNSGSSDMTIDGSVNFQAFSVEASQDFDIFVKYISVEIGDGGNPKLNDFGALSPLTIGVQWEYFTHENGLDVLHDGIKTNKAFIRIGGDTHAIGSGTSAFLADVSGGVSEKSYLPNIDMAETFGMPFGLRIRKGSTDRVSFVVRDDLTELTTFDIVAYGIRV